jgi:hypothetical protein
MLLSDYVKKSFQYVKTHRTWSDRIIYDRVIPKISLLFRRKPLYGIAMILFFEIYGVTFYRDFKRKAEEDGLSELARLLALIQKDESRHLAGIHILVQDYHREFGKPGVWDRWVIGLLLRVLVFDINMRKHAFHNKAVRESICQLAMDPDSLTQAAILASQRVLIKIKGSYVDLQTSAG